MQFKETLLLWGNNKVPLHPPCTATTVSANDVGLNWKELSQDLQQLLP